MTARGSQALIHSRLGVAGLGGLTRTGDRAKGARPRNGLTPKQAQVLAWHDAGISLTAIARLLGWKPKPDGKYNGAGVRVMLDVAILKSGRDQ